MLLKAHLLTYDGGDSVIALDPVPVIETSDYTTDHNIGERLLDTVRDGSLWHSSHPVGDADICWDVEWRADDTALVSYFWASDPETDAFGGAHILWEPAFTS